MNGVQRYLLRQLAGPLVFFALALTGVIWLTQSLRFVDLIVNRGMAYTLAGASIAAVYLLSIALVGDVVRTRIPSAGTTGLVVAILVSGALFEPLRKWIQARIDRVFYRRRYDYRHTLV